MVLDEVARLRALARYEEAVTRAEQALATVRDPVAAERLSFEIGSILTYQIADNARANVHIDLLTGRDFHHGAEAIFKSFARALRQAAALDPRLAGAVPSTKGVL